MFRRVLLPTAILWLATLVGTAAQGAENVIELAVEVTASDGSRVAGRIPVTVYRPPGEGPFPAVVVSHGRPGMRAERERMGRVRMGSVATTLLGRNMVVLVPTRLGYGQTSTADPEFFVSCREPHYERAFAAGAEQVAAAVQYARSLPYVDAGRIYLVGHSVGGGITASAAARGLPGVRAAVLFSATHGGRDGQPPCREDRLQQTFASYGGTAVRVPQLWIYVENDDLVPAALARDWFNAYTAAGGAGSFRLVPAKRNAHYWFLSEPGEWREAVFDFFTRHGL
jgi:dienelactone hydrolase